MNDKGRYRAARAAKNLPTDPFFKAVEIKESRKRSSVVRSLDGNLE